MPSPLAMPGETDLTKIVWNPDSRHGRVMNTVETLKIVKKTKEEVLAGRWQVGTIEQRLKLALQRSGKKRGPMRPEGARA